MKNPLKKDPSAKALRIVLKDGDSKRIAEAVRLAEQNTSSEIMVKLSAATSEESVRSVAEAEFTRLGLAALPLGNGVLIYVSLNRRAVEIVVGPEASAQLPETLWKSAADAIADGFRNKQAANGIIAGVEVMAEPLAKQFPPSDTAGVDLPNVSEDS